MKTIKITEETWKMLNYYKTKYGMKNFSNTIKIVIEKASLWLYENNNQWTYQDSEIIDILSKNEKK